MSVHVHTYVMHPMQHMYKDFTVLSMAVMLF